MDHLSGMQMRWGQRREAALILAGGAGLRMLGWDKGLMPCRGQALIEYPLTAVRQAGLPVSVSSNRSPLYYRSRGLRVCGERSAHYPGPLVALAEVLEGLVCSHCVVLPCDTPHFTADDLARLLKASRQHPEHWIVAGSRDGIHPLHGVFPRFHLETLVAQVAAGERRVMRLLDAIPHRVVRLPERALTNVNHLRQLRG